MSTEKNRWVEAVTKLIKLTQEGELKWTVEEPPASFSKRPDAGVEVVFLSTHGDKRLRLYEKRFQEESIHFDQDEWLPVQVVEWKKMIVLEFVDEIGNSLWAFPAVNALNDLVSAVQYQVAGVRDFLADLLAAS